jgi:hypothetical protein
MFQRNISPPSSWSKSKPSKKPEAGGKLDCSEDVLGSKASAPVILNIGTGWAEESLYDPLSKYTL